jgi:hypothetical protein
MVQHLLAWERKWNNKCASEFWIFGPRIKKQIIIQRFENPWDSRLTLLWLWMPLYFGIWRHASMREHCNSWDVYWQSNALKIFWNSNDVEMCRHSNVFEMYWYRNVFEICWYSIVWRCVDTLMLWRCVDTVRFLRCVDIEMFWRSVDTVLFGDVSTN